MRTNDTATRFEIPDAETLAKIAQYRLADRDRFATFDYPAKHRRDDDAPSGVRHHAPGHHATELIPPVSGEKTERIEVGHMRVRVPAPQPKARGTVVVPPPREPVAEVTVGLLERVLNGLRKLGVAR